MFEAETGEGGGVGVQEVEGVTEGGGGGVVAGEEEEFDLVHEEAFHFGGEGVWFFVLVLGGGGGGKGDLVAGDGFAGEVGGEGEVDDGFAAGDIGVMGGGTVDGEAGVEFGGEVVVHFAGVEPEDEGAEGVVAGEGEAFASEGEPFHLTPHGGYHPVFFHLGVELFVAGRCKYGTACVPRGSYKTTLPMTSIARLSVKVFISKTFPRAARLSRTSQSTLASSTMPGTRVMRLLALNPGLKTLLQVFHCWPSMQTRSTPLVNGDRKSLIAGNLGSTCSWVIWDRVDGDVTTSVGLINGHASM